MARFSIVKRADELDARSSAGQDRRGRRKDRRQKASTQPAEVAREASVPESVAALREAEVRRRLVMLDAFLPAWINEAHLLFVAENAELFRDDTWRPEFNRWVSAEHAIISAQTASRLATEIAQLSDEGEGRLRAAADARALEQERLSDLLERGWPEEKRPDGIELPVVRDWVQSRSELLKLPLRRWDPRVHFERRRINRRLSESETHILPRLPREVLNVIGPLNDTGRSTLAYVLEGLVGYVKAEEIVDETAREKQELSARLNTLVDQVREHDISPPEARLDLYGWRAVAGEARGITAQAREAAGALTRQRMRDAITSEARALLDRWSAAAADSPALQSWSAGRGKAFTMALTELDREIGADGIDGMCALLQEGALQQLAGAVHIALHAHDQHSISLRDETLTAHGAVSLTLVS
jgi:hypothetical protein